MDSSLNHIVSVISSFLTGHDHNDTDYPTSFQRDHNDNDTSDQAQAERVDDSGEEQPVSYSGIIVGIFFALFVVMLVIAFFGYRDGTLPGIIATHCYPLQLEFFKKPKLLQNPRSLFVPQAIQEAEQGRRRQELGGAEQVGVRHGHAVQAEPAAAAAARHSRDEHVQRRARHSHGRTGGAQWHRLMRARGTNFPKNCLVFPKELSFSLLVVTGDFFPPINYRAGLVVWT